MGGYELFYYYNGDDTLDDSSIVFDIYRVQDVVSSASAERCGENLFAYRIRLSDSASLSPGSKLPSEALSYSVHRGDWQPYDRRVFASWQESSGPMENPKMAALVTFQATSVPLAAPCQTDKASMAAPRCEPMAWVMLLAISSPLVSVDACSILEIYSG